MFEKRTFVVVGAGASNEARLPTGSELKAHVAHLLDIRFDFGRLISGDPLISDALRIAAQNEQPSSRDINPYLHEAWHIRDAIPQAISIDNFLDAHQGNARLERCGKLAVVRSILEGERNSLLYVDPRGRDRHPNYTALSLLLSRARYFGRAESRASVKLAEPDQQKPDGYFEATPSGHARGAPMVRRNVLVTTPEFNAPDLWRVRKPSRVKGKVDPRSGASTGDTEAPQHFVEALISAKKPLPDGTRWLEYELPRPAVVQQLPKRRISRASSPVVPAAEIHFRLFRRVPIPVLQTVLLARDFRDQAVRRYSHATGRDSVLLSGREEDGSIARGHRHAYYLPRPTRSSAGFLEQLVVVLPGGELGVDQEVLDAMLGITRLLRRDPYPVLVVPEEVRAAPTTSIASTWRSLTPFLPPLQHRPGRDRTDPVQQMLRAVEERVERTPAQTSLMDRQVVPVLSHLYISSDAGTELPQRHRITRRAGFVFELEFSEPVQFPATIGIDAHFGLGQFEPADSDVAEVAQQQHAADGATRRR